MVGSKAAPAATITALRRQRQNMQYQPLTKPIFGRPKQLTLAAAVVVAAVDVGTREWAEQRN